ncbi:geranylgeranyl reductase family protein [Ammonifex thiophilus]|uniref:geranylgeranyl reductase family protein n=1 Tax=Ammonifex thiophilus TaxID=444093 RepID=UPI0014041F90|nr:geranylgeranyl reductase family protein [Ammonifex thiophilus]
MKSSWPVIVVGAGPAGALCAYSLARAGLSVLLLEKACFPREKPCGGGLTPKAAALLPFSFQAVVDGEVKRAILRLPGVKTLEIGWGRPVCFLVRRELLDTYLAEQARRAGAFLREGEEVVQIEETGEALTVITAGGASYRAQLVIGADGALSRVARLVGRSLPRRFALTAAITPPPAWSEKRDTILIDLEALPYGYGWVFPKAGHLNAGVGSFAAARELRFHWENFARRNGLGRPLRLRAHPLALAGEETELGRGRVMLLGDAAGLVDPLTGEGLYAAFCSAQLAAKAILEEGVGERAVPRYRELVKASLGREYHFAHRLARLFYRFLPLIARYFSSRPEQVRHFWEFLFFGGYAELFRRAGARYWEKLLRGPSS